MHTILRDLNNTSANIQASAVISIDGIVIASVLPQGMNEDTFGAVSAALSSVGNHSIRDLAGGVLEHIMIKSSQNYILMAQVGKEAVLTVIVKSAAEPERVMLNIKLALEKMMPIA